MCEHTPMPNTHIKWLAAPYDHSDVTPANIPIFGKSTVKILNNPVIFGGSPPERLSFVESQRGRVRRLELLTREDYRIEPS